MTVSGSIHVSTNNPISFLLMAEFHCVYISHLPYPFMSMDKYMDTKGGKGGWWDELGDWD